MWIFQTKNMVRNKLEWTVISRLVWILYPCIWRDLTHWLQHRKHSHSSFSRYAFLTDLSELTDLLVDFYSLLLFVLIVYLTMYPQTSKHGKYFKKKQFQLNSKFQLFLKIVFCFWQICQIWLSWKTRVRAKSFDVLGEVHVGTFSE